jgi:hypothetical protein
MPVAYDASGDGVHPTTRKDRTILLTMLRCTPALHVSQAPLPVCYVVLLLLLLLVYQAGERLCLEWVRGRVFDQDVGGLFAAAVREGGSLQVGHECHCRSPSACRQLLWPCGSRSRTSSGCALASPPSDYAM